jgi:ABC-type molybdate transport system ATPase subunit
VLKPKLLLIDEPAADLDRHVIRGELVYYRSRRLQEIAIPQRKNVITNL